MRVLHVAMAAAVSIVSLFASPVRAVDAVAQILSAKGKKK